MSAVITLIMIELRLLKSIGGKRGRTQSVNRLFSMTDTHSACTGRPCSCPWPAPPRRTGVRRVWARAPCTLGCAASRSRTCTLTTRSTRSSCRPLRGNTATETRVSMGRRDAHKGHSEACFSFFIDPFVHRGLISPAAPEETDDW